MKKHLALIALCSAAATPALAVERPYIAVDYELMNYAFKVGAANPEFDVTAARLRAGTMLNRWFGVEAHVGMGVDDDTQQMIPGVGTSATTLELNKAYGLYGVARLPMGRGGLFTYAGYAYVDTEVAIRGFSASQEENGLSYGAGLDIPAPWGMSLELDYKQVLDEGNLNLTSFGVGLRKNF